MWHDVTSDEHEVARRELAPLQVEQLDDATLQLLHTRAWEALRERAHAQLRRTISLLLTTDEAPAQVEIRLTGLTGTPPTQLTPENVHVRATGTDTTVPDDLAQTVAAEVAASRFAEMCAWEDAWTGGATVLHVNSPTTPRIGDTAVTAGTVVRWRPTYGTDLDATVTDVDRGGEYVDLRLAGGQRAACVPVWQLALP